MGRPQWQVFAEYRPNVLREWQLDEGHRGNERSCLVVAVDSLPTVTCLDPESLKIIAELDAGTGNIIDIRTDLKANRIQIFGDQDTIRIWPFRQEVTAEVP